jgi:hypothetical protein
MDIEAFKLRERERERARGIFLVRALRDEGVSCS